MLCVEQGRALTNVFDLRGAFKDVKGDIGLVEQHAEGQTSETGSDDQNIWAGW